MKNKVGLASLCNVTLAAFSKYCFSIINIDREKNNNCDQYIIVYLLETNVND